MTTNHEWLLRNSMRSYPVREDSTVVATNSGWPLPPGLIVDLMISGDHAAESVFLQSVTITKSICSVVLADVATGQSLAVASVVKNGPTDVPLQSIVEGVEGYISFGPLMMEEFYVGLPPGMHLFDGTLIEERCVLLSGPMPVTGIVNPAGGTFRGAVAMTSSANLDMTIEDGKDGEIPVKYVTLSLASPMSFISPCEEKSSVCGCKSPPIKTINGVPGDASSVITIEIEDENGQIYLLGTSLLSMLLTRTVGALCSKPEEPDGYGRLKGTTGTYADDTPPLTPYQNPQDTTFPTPVI